MPSVIDTLTTSPSVNLGAGSATQQVLPDWYTSLISTMAQRGTQVASQPYQPYTGARVAGFSPLQQAGFDNIQGVPQAGAGATQAGVQAAQGAAGSQWNSTYRDQYMSPYIGGVVDDIARRGNRNFTENLMPAVNGAFTGSGQFGSTRNAEILGRTMRDVQDNITGAQSNALQAGYTGAQNQFSTDQARALQAGTALGGLGQMQQQQALTGANALIGAGTVQQNQQQRGLDTAYADFNEARNYDMNQLGGLRQLLQGLQLPAGATSASNQASGTFGSSPLELILALLNGG